MRRVTKLLLPLIFAFLGFAAIAAPAHASAYGVEDNANFFTPSAVSKANSLIDDIRVGDNRDVLVVTYATIPADQLDGLKTKGKQEFYEDWAESIRKQNRASGILILLVKDPGRLEINVGNKTQEHSFTLDDRKVLNDKMLPFLKDKKYDDALLQGLAFIKKTMKRVQGNAPVAPTANGSIPTDAKMSPNASSGTPNYTPPVVTPTGFPVLGLICAGVAILAVVVIILNIVNRSRNSGGGYNSPPSGGYPPGYSGGYPQGGGGYGYGGGGGGGGGFGRGLLGGLLGGALGAWGYEKFNQGSSTPNYNPPPPSGGGGNFGNSSNDQTDTSSSGGGSDFGSSNDSSNSGGGADFGSSSDSSSGGSDFGSGGDSSGGGDFGGGGDSGSSSGGDF